MKEHGSRTMVHNTELYEREKIRQGGSAYVFEKANEKVQETNEERNGCGDGCSSGYNHWCIRTGLVSTGGC